MSEQELNKIIDKVAEDLKNRHDSEIEMEMIDLTSASIAYELKKVLKERN